MKYLLLAVVSLPLLAACQKPETGPVLDGKVLAERFIKPAGDQAIAGVVFNKQGDAIAVTADGKILQPCRLPSLEGDAGKAAGVESAQVPECHGTTNTSIYKISQVTVVRHKGSECMTFSIPVGDSVVTDTFCWD